MIEPKQNAVIQTNRIDTEHLQLLRANIADFLRRGAAEYASGPALLLDVAPQDHRGARFFFPDEVTVETLDISPDAQCTYIADLCVTNLHIQEKRFDFIVCTEVLEHTGNPFLAINEMHRLLKPGGVLFLSTPFNLRIHGPLPDCWRFTEHGLRMLLSDFDLIEITALETDDRPLMPIQYTVVARKPV